MYKDTVTLFNRKPGERGQGDTWYPTVIKNVNLNIDRAAIVAQYGPESQDNAALSVRYKTVDGNIIISGKPWMPPKEWDGTEDSITFTSGSAFDFFWCGEWTGGIVTDAEYLDDVTDAEHLDEGFYGHMNRTHDYVFAITSVSRLSVIPHFEITGK